MFKKRELKQMTAYQKKAIHDIFLMSIEWLEKYIEVTYEDYYPDWKNKKQVKDNLTIKRKDIYENPKRAETTLSSQLHLFAATLEDDATPKLREELKQEFYKWISATGIDVNNCPERLKQFIFGINEIFEKGREKIGKDIENRKREIEMDSPEYMKMISNMFADTQIPMREGAELEKSMKNKNPDEVVINKFAGSVEKGEQIFKGIAKSIAGSHENFYFKEQKGQRQSVDILPSDKVDKITTEIDRFGRAKKQEIMLVRQGARLKDFKEGKLDFTDNPIYKWNDFKVQQKFEMKNTLPENRIYLDKAYLTDDEIGFVIKEFSDKPGVWRTEPIQGCECLIHSSAQGDNNREIGTLIHSKEKFSEAEWMEVNEVLELNKQHDIVLKKLKGEISPEYGETREALEIWVKELEKKLLINGIRKNADKWEIREESFNKSEVLIRKTAKVDINEDYDLAGWLINRSNEFYGKDYFDDKEWAEIGNVFFTYKIIEKINQNKSNWMIANVGGDNGYQIVLNKETALMDGGKKLNVNGEYYKKEDFSDRGWEEIGNSFYNSQNQQQHVSKLMIGENQRDNKDNGRGKIFGILGIISVLVISGVIVMRKKLNKKPKK